MESYDCEFGEFVKFSEIFLNLKEFGCLKKEFLICRELFKRKLEKNKGNCQKICVIHQIEKHIF